MSTSRTSLLIFLLYFLFSSLIFVEPSSAQVEKDPAISDWSIQQSKQLCGVWDAVLLSGVSVPVEGAPSLAVFQVTGLSGSSPEVPEAMINSRVIAAGLGSDEDSRASFRLTSLSVRGAEVERKTFQIDGYVLDDEGVRGMQGTVEEVNTIPSDQPNNIKPCPLCSPIVLYASSRGFSYSVAGLVGIDENGNRCLNTQGWSVRPKFVQVGAGRRVKLIVLCSSDLLSFMNAAVDRSGGNQRYDVSATVDQ